MYAYIAHIEFVGRAALIRVLSIFTLIEVKSEVPRDDHHHALTRNGFLNDTAGGVKLMRSRQQMRSRFDLPPYYLCIN